MLRIFENLMAKKMRVQVMIQGVHQENCHFIQTAVKSWGIPGFIDVQHARMIKLVLEGAEPALRQRMNELSENPYVKYTGRPLNINWLPAKGDLAAFNVVF